MSQWTERFLCDDYEKARQNREMVARKRSICTGIQVESTLTGMTLNRILPKWSLGVKYPTASCGALREGEPPHPKLRTRPPSSRQQADGYSAVIFIRGLYHNLPSEDDDPLWENVRKIREDKMEDVVQ